MANADEGICAICSIPSNGHPTGAVADAAASILERQQNGLRGNRLPEHHS